MKAWQFGRAVVVMAAFDEAREHGEKHSAAVRYAVEAVKQRNSKIPISETEVKRILATFRPKGGRTILRFELSILTPEQVEERWRIREYLASLPENKGLMLQPLSTSNRPKSFTTFKIRFAERPNYPRHNRKTPSNHA
jgi:hypothetical protein